MTIKVKLSFEDYYKCMYEMVYRRLYLFLYVIGSVMLLSVLLHFFIPAGKFPFPQLFVGLIFTLLPFFFQKNLKKSFESNRLLQEEITYDFQEEYVCFSSENSNTKIFWSNLFQIKDTKNFILLYSANQIANIIPKEAFGNQLDDFKTLAKAKCAKVKFK